MNAAERGGGEIEGVALTLEDLLAAARDHYLSSILRRRVTITAAAIAVCAFCYGAFVVPAWGWSLGWGLAFGFGSLIWFYGIMALLFFVALPRNVRRQWRDNQLLHETLEIEWNARGYRAEGRNVRSDMPWSYYLAWRETDAAILLYYSQHQYQLLPKRYLSERQLADLREHLAGAGIPGPGRQMRPRVRTMKAS